jgi:hypothetical protein
MIATRLLGTYISLAGKVRECLKGQVPKIMRGLHLAPVLWNFEQINVLLVGLGSYIVNTQGSCDDCHTNPFYAPGGSLFRENTSKLMPTIPPTAVRGIP